MSVDDQIAGLLVGSGVNDISTKEIFRIAIDRAKRNEISIHPYGFHIVKIRVTSEYQLRLHLWLQGVRPMQEPKWLPHDHCFDIDSLILSGEMRHKTWRIDESSSNRGVIYDVSYQGDTSVLARTNDLAGLALEEDHTYQEKHIYHLGKGIFHSIEVPADRLLATLCVASNYSDTPSRVFGEIGSLDRYEFNRRKVSSVGASLTIDALCSLQESYV